MRGQSMEFHFLFWRVQVLEYVAQTFPQCFAQLLPADGLEYKHGLEDLLCIKCSNSGFPHWKRFRKFYRPHLVYKRALLLHFFFSGCSICISFISGLTASENYWS